MTTVNFEHGTLIHGRQNRMGTFDADISMHGANRLNNADLTVYLRINFQKIDPTPGNTTYRDWDNTAVPIRAWRGQQFDRWKRRFMRDCKRKWDRKFWLLTPQSYTGLNVPRGNPVVRSNLYCRFDISEQATSAGAHAVIPVVRIDGNHTFRSHMLLYDDRDLRPQTRTEGSTFFTHVHEIGHLMGLNHPGDGLPGCTAGGGDPACYADAGGDDTGVMGRGSRIMARHATPWKKAAAALTSTRETDWTAFTSRVFPSRL